jgi:hypothetical protein
MNVVTIYEPVVSSCYGVNIGEIFMMKKRRRFRVEMQKVVGCDDNKAYCKRRDHHSCACGIKTI